MTGDWKKVLVKNITVEQSFLDESSLPFKIHGHGFISPHVIVAYWGFLRVQSNFFGLSFSVENNKGVISIINYNGPLKIFFKLLAWLICFNLFSIF